MLILLSKIALANLLPPEIYDKRAAEACPKGSLGYSSPPMCRPNRCSEDKDCGPDATCMEQSLCLLNSQIGELVISNCTINSTCNVGSCTPEKVCVANLGEVKEKTPGKVLPPHPVENTQEMKTPKCGVTDASGFWFIGFALMWIRQRQRWL